MPDHRHHRGPHPEDAALFASAAHGGLRAGTADLSWLLTRGYASPSALKVVGDRYGLTARQRMAVMRSACTDAARANRRANRVEPVVARGRPLLLDGYNVLTTVEAALGGGVVIVGRDGAWRDMASLHGTWRGVDETVPALDLIGRYLADVGVGPAVWYLDSPVSNSGRLKAAIAAQAAERGWDWRVELVPDPDAVLRAVGAGAADPAGGRGVIVATADSAILDAGVRWLPVAEAVIRWDVPGAWVVDLSGD